MALQHLYTKKQLEILKRLKQKDWFILGLHGAKRSGKTVINNDVFLKELIRVKEIAKNQGINEPMYILAGVSSKTIQNNILNELYNKYGISVKLDKHNNFKLYGVKVVQAYTGTIGGLGAIRGMTSFGAYINEASLSNEQVFKEIISRCSGEGARIVFDTNPDNPEHWLKKEYIDAINDNYVMYHFKLDDNTFLNERYRVNIKESTPSGMFYDRDIEGLWVSGEGVVYSDFDQSKHYYHTLENVKFKRFFCGVDWGYKHYGAIVLIGESIDNKYYLIEEYAEQLKEIDYWLTIAKDINTRYPGIKFYCDSARPEYITKFTANGIYAITASKERLSGIETVARLIKNDQLFINANVKRFKEEIYNYVWDKTKDDTIKLYDDVLDALRYALHTAITSQKVRAGNRQALGL